MCVHVRVFMYVFVLIFLFILTSRKGPHTGSAHSRSSAYKNKCDACSNDTCNLSFFLNNKTRTEYVAARDNKARDISYGLIKSERGTCYSEGQK